MNQNVRCLIFTRISKDKLGDGHGVANQLADLEKRAAARGWTVTHRLSDNDIDVAYCRKWDRFIRGTGGHRSRRKARRQAERDAKRRRRT